MLCVLGTTAHKKPRMVPIRYNIKHARKVLTLVESLGGQPVVWRPVGLPQAAVWAGV